MSNIEQNNEWAGHKGEPLIGQLTTCPSTMRRFFQIQVATLQARPEQVSPPLITVESSTILYLVWQAPAKPNGNVVKYEIYEAAVGLVVNLTGSSRQYTITGDASLSHFIKYIQP